VPKKADPLGNPGTSRVFYALVPEPKIPSVLATSLRMTHVSVIEHLNGLQGAGVVRRGKKEGRIRYYCIDWRGVAHAMFEQSVFSTFRLDVGLPERPPAPAGLDEMAEVAERLEGNGVFLRLLRGYFRAVPWYRRVSPIRTVRGELAEFEFGVLRAFERLEGALERSGDRSVREFVELMRRYREFYREWIRPDSALASASNLAGELRLREECVRSPGLIEEGFTIQATDVLTPSGELLTLVGRDRRGRAVVVEFRSGTASPADVRRLERCVAAAAEGRRSRPRGVLVAHGVTSDAEELLHLRGLEFRGLTGGAGRSRAKERRGGA